LAIVTRIVDIDRLEIRAVLDFLFRQVERPDFIVRWKWAAKDIALWDNRAVQHYAVPDYTTTRRMQRTPAWRASAHRVSPPGRRLGR
jgi:taurine dioxygenase